MAAGDGERVMGTRAPADRCMQRRLDQLATGALSTLGMFERLECEHAPGAEICRLFSELLEQAWDSQSRPAVAIDGFAGAEAFCGMLGEAGVPCGALGVVQPRSLKA